MVEGSHNEASGEGEGVLGAFHSPLVDRLRRQPQAGRWALPGGEIVLPRVFGFCRGVTRALAMADRAVRRHAEARSAGRLVLLGEIIHNPWVNDSFRRRGVVILTDSQRQPEALAEHVGPGDGAIIPAFGVPVGVLRTLESIGCETVDCSCGDVIRLWRWSEHAVADGFGVVVFGRAGHDETVVTRSRLLEAGGTYIVLGTLEQIEQFAELYRHDADEAAFAETFDASITNARSLTGFARLAQVSQTTMLYNDTQEVRRILQEAVVDRFGPEGLSERLRLQPTVCRATQDRQNAATELCRSGCDLLIVVGGFGSSNTRHLHELAGQYAPAYLIEDARGIVDAGCLRAFDPARAGPGEVEDWLPKRRPVRIGVLAGASSPEVVVGEVLRRLGEFLQFPGG